MNYKENGCILAARRKEALPTECSHSPKTNHMAGSRGKGSWGKLGVGEGVGVGWGWGSKA